MVARRSEEEWAKLIAKFEKSGQSLEQFCRPRDIKPKTLSWWRWQLRERDAARGQAKDVRMVEVALAHPVSPERSLVSIVVGDVSVNVEVGTDAQYVGALVAALRSSC
jgi:transposase-like protein